MAFPQHCSLRKKKSLSRIGGLGSAEKVHASSDISFSIKSSSFLRYGSSSYSLMVYSHLEKVSKVPQKRTSRPQLKSKGNYLIIVNTSSILSRLIAK